METPEAMANPVDLDRTVKMLRPRPQHHKARDARSASQPRTAHLDHPAQPEAQDSPVDQDRMLKEADPDQLDPPAHPDPMDSPADQATQEDQDSQDRCTRLPAARDHPDPPAQMDNPAAQDNPDPMVNPADLDSPAHQETTVVPVAQDSQEAQDNPAAMASREAKALATTAHPHALPPDIKPSRCGEEELQNDFSRVPIPDFPQIPLPQISIDSAVHVLTPPLLALLLLLLNSSIKGHK
jgi:hypothetical protein